MGSPEKITATEEGNPAWLERLLDRLLRCSHRHKTSPMTLRGETFATCLDCGGRVPYSLDALRAGPPGKPGKNAVGKIPVAKQPGYKINPALVNSTLRKWTREGVWLGLGLLAAGFTGGIFYSGQQNRPMAETGAEIHRTAQTSHLQSDGRTVPLAHEAAAALEAAQHPGKLAELIQSGSIFTVSRGTPVRVVETKQSVVRVVITAGSLAGQEAWVPTSRVSSE